MYLKDNAIHEWKSLSNTDRVRDNLTLTTIPSDKATAYTGNLVGLMRNELDIPMSCIYINMLVNNYNSSLEYGGDSSLYILDPEIATELLYYIQSTQDT